MPGLTARSPLGPGWTVPEAGVQHGAMTSDAHRDRSWWSMLTVVGGVLVAATGMGLLALPVLWGGEMSALRSGLAAGQVVCGAVIAMGAIRSRRRSRE